MGSIWGGSSFKFGVFSRKKVEAPPPKGIKTAALNMIPALQERISALNTEIEAVKAERVAVEAANAAAKQAGNQNPIKNANAVAALFQAENSAGEVVESSNLRAWQKPDQAGNDPAGGAAVIEAWDAVKADALLDEALAADAEHPPIHRARQFISDRDRTAIIVNKSAVLWAMSCFSESGRSS